MRSDEYKSHQFHYARTISPTFDDINVPRCRASSHVSRLSLKCLDTQWHTHLHRLCIVRVCVYVYCVRIPCEPTLGPRSLLLLFRILDFVSVCDCASLHLWAQQQWMCRIFGEVYRLRHVLSTRRVDDEEIKKTEENKKWIYQIANSGKVMKEMKS